MTVQWRAWWMYKRRSKSIGAVLKKNK